MRNVKLFRAEPKDRDADWSPARASAFHEDPRSLAVHGASDIIVVSVPADRLPSLKRTGTDGYMVPAALARDHSVAGQDEMERLVAMKDAYEQAKAVRRSMALTTVDCALPGEMSPVARVLWRHVPEVAARVGVNVAPEEGGPVLQHMERDVSLARPVSDYVSCREDAQFLKDVCSGVSTASAIMRDVAGVARPEPSRTAVMASRMAAAGMSR
jgi:hypothetical protein